MDLSVVIPVCILTGSILIWGIYALVKLVFSVEDGKKFQERINDLKKALEVSNYLAEDRKQALDSRVKEVYEFKFNLIEANREIEKGKEKYANLLHQKKSTEVRVGQISEQIAPFLHAWPWKSGRFRFIGAPIDGISFEDDKVVFVEIKTGKGRLSPSQLRIRKQIRERKVEWVEFRVEPDGYNIKEG